MDLTLFSNVLLDSQGNFSYQNLFQAFCEIASRHQRPYPGLSYHLFPETTHDHSTSTILYPTSCQENSLSILQIPTLPTKDDCLEAISDDEDEEDNTQSSSTLLSNPSPSLESSHSAPWSKLRQSIPVTQTAGGEVPTSTPYSWNPISSPPLPKPRVQHRLKLVLDLDNTLLHAIARNKIANVDINLGHFRDSESLPEMYKFVLPQALTQTYYIKLRPGLREFLRETSEYCDLAIHTNATREYADVIVSILDPDRSLFAGRIAAREDETAKDYKKNMDRLFGIEDLDVRSLLILDDRTDVWDNAYHPNIVQCGMYEYLDNRKHALIAKYPPTQECPTIVPIVNEGVNTTAMVTGIPTTTCTWGQTSSFPVGGQSSVLTASSPFLQSRNGTGDEQSPFSDNPLIRLTSEDLTTTADDEDCEDDDLISTPTAESGNCVEEETKINATTNAVVSIPDQVDMINNRSAVPNTTEMTTVKGVTLRSIDEALIDYDSQLDYIRKLIISVAEEFNQLKNGVNGDEASVARIIMCRRREILKDIVVQTVGMYKSESMHPEHGWRDNGPQHRRRLVALGAHVAESTIPSLTHVVAMRITATIDRVKKERGNDVKYVHALWLNACELTWSRLPEEWFEASLLLNRYHNLPPRKPWVDAWKLIVMNDGKPFSRIYEAKNAFSDNEPERSIPVREHLVTGAYSHGARVWSSTEEIVLKYDQIESNRLFLALQSETVSSINFKPNSLHLLRENDAQHNFDTSRITNMNSSYNSFTQSSSRRRADALWCNDDIDTNIDTDGGTTSSWGPRRKRQRQDHGNPKDHVNDWSVERPRRHNRRWRSSLGDSLNHNDSSWNQYSNKDETITSPWSLPSWNINNNNNNSNTNQPWTCNTNNSQTRRNNSNDYQDQWRSPPTVEQDNYSIHQFSPSDSPFSNQSLQSI